MEKLIFGAAYYDEYMPYDRLDQDIYMMKKAGINTIRIGESTWSTCEPQEGVFDFSHLDRVMDAVEKEGLGVIIGTPTYAVPTWMVKSHPDVMVTTKEGRKLYGARQIMDITHPVYLFYAERVIRKLMEHTAGRKCVIGFQIDNETKHYGTAGKNVQERFVKYLRYKFEDNLDKLNAEFGLDYWSNRINAWEDFPDVRGTINGSLGAEFEKFQRTLVDEFLSWQAGIVNEYRRQDQFITHNFDYEWRGYSFGVQPDVNHLHASENLSLAGVDIYHPTQEQLTGAEISFGGDMSRCLKQKNYLVLETQAQGFPGWTPYNGQLRLQAYSHIASGANGVMYWHWHSIHNSKETYWKGVLSHDFQENHTYREACVIGNEWKRVGQHLVNLKKKNDVAILVSNESLTALKWFGIEATESDHGKTEYNDVVRWIYDAFYRMNVECDFVWPDTQNLERYRLLIVPALYAAPDELLERLDVYVKNGGNLVTTFKTGFANENVKVSSEIQPRILRNCLGIHYHEFTFPEQVGLNGSLVGEKETFEAKTFMELLIPDTAEVLLSYEHYNWKEYAAVTKNRFGNGNAYYIGCMMDEKLLERILQCALMDSDIVYDEKYRFPVIIKKGVNDFGNKVWFYFNYSREERDVVYSHGFGKELLEDKEITSGEILAIPAWGMRIIEETTDK